MRARRLLALAVGIFMAVGANTLDTCIPSDCLIVLNCRCPLEGPITPGGLSDQRDIPQFVTLTFQGPITPEIDRNLKAVFKEKHKNDDGCFQKATFFIPGKVNNWKAVKELYENGHEIGAYSNSYTTMQQYWRDIKKDTIKEEAVGIKRTIQKEADIPESQIRGWRTPLLEVGGDIMMKGLRDAGFEYDSSIKIDVAKKIWPFTLDHGWTDPSQCGRFTNACIKNVHKGFWEFPVIVHENYITGGTMATFSKITDENADDIYEIIKRSFNSYYGDKKSPFMMTFTSSYFAGDFGKIRVKALQEFLQYLSEQRDVYVTTLHDMLQWIKNPRVVADMRNSCKEKKVDKASDKTVYYFDHRQLTRYQRFLYYYGARPSDASRPNLLLSALLLPVTVAILKWL